MITGKSIAKGALVVMAATLMSRLFGFIRETQIAKYFGASGDTDAYLVAFSVPTGIGLAIAAALSAGFIPVLNNYFVLNERDNAAKVTNTLLNIIFLVLLALTALGIFFAPSLVARLAPGFGPESVRLTVDLITVMFPSLVFISLMGLAAGFLNSRQHFLFPALGPMVTSIVIIGSILIWDNSLGIKGLAVGTLVGSTLQLLVQILVMYQKGFRYKLEFAVFHPGVKKVFKMMAPVLVASLVPLVMVLVEKGLASKLTTGSISALNYAFRLMQLPQGLFVMAVSVGLLVLDEPIVRLLFQRGAFKAKDTIPTAYALAFYSLALLPLALRDVFRRVFYAVQNTLTPVSLTIGSFVLNIVLDLFLVKAMGLGGLALGAALSVLAESIILYALLSRRLSGFPQKSFLTLLLKLAAAAVIMGAAAYYCSKLIGIKFDMGTVRGSMLQVGSSVVVGFLTYLLVLVVLRVKEIGEALEMLKGVFKKVVPGKDN